MSLEKNFEYDGNLIRTITEDQQTWLPAIDVCAVLEIANATQAVGNLDDDEKKLTYVKHSSGSPKKTWTINEPGFYNLVLKSRKPEAKAFRKWLTHEVIPAIRRAGRYSNEQMQSHELNIQKLVYEIDKVEEERDYHHKKSLDLRKTRDRKQAELRLMLKSDPNQVALLLEERE